jgi:glycosyltransferase involved in cell wall biosynthesis
VIPTCVDLQRFNLNHAIEGELSEGIEKFHGKFLLVYSGSLSTWFMPNEMLIFFEILKKNIMDAHFLILTPEKTLLKNILENKKLYRDSISVLNVDHQSVPRYLMQAKAGMVFYRQGYSNKGRSPTKVGEYLACGLPVIINRDIGDSEEIIKKEGVGFIIEEFSNSEYERVSGQLKKALLDLDSLRQKCFATARKYYSLDQGVEKYWQVYQGLLKR